MLTRSRAFAALANLGYTSELLLLLVLLLLLLLCARFQELTQVWAINQSQLLDHISGTTYLSTYVIQEFHWLLKMHLFCLEPCCPATVACTTP